MTGKDMILTEILGAAIRNKEFQIDKYKMESIDWRDFYSKARALQVHMLIYPVIRKIDPQIGPDEKLMALWNISVLTCGIQMICDEVGIGEVIETLDAMRIRTIVLKGIAINKYYPQPELRTMKDADILIHEDDIDRAIVVFKGLGYIAKRDKNTKHIEFSRNKALSIKVYSFLTDFNLIKESELFHTEIWEESIGIKVGLAEAHAPSWDMQVICLCIQMAMQITYGSFDLRQLCDLAIVVEKNKEQINWNIIKAKVIKYCVDEFVYTIFEVCKRLFHIKVPQELECLEKRKYENVERLISDIFKEKKSHKKDMQNVSNIFIKKLQNYKKTNM